MHLKIFILALFAALFLSATDGSGTGQPDGPQMAVKIRIGINHLGYEANSEKRAVIEAPAESELNRATVYSYPDGQRILSTEVKKSGPVQQWKNWFFWTVDFSSVSQEGQYVLLVEGKNLTQRSFPFLIRHGLLVEETLSDVIFHFKSQRSSGDYDRTDRSLPFYGGRDGKVDARGGWYDASGDTSKYLSHLCYTNTMCPQQSPLLVWGLLDALDHLKKRKKGLYPEVEKRIVDEAVYGADFLVRMQDPAGYFYVTVFDKWSKVLSERMICAYKTQNGDRTDEYQAAFREGGGVAIAALARVAAQNRDGDFKAADYLRAAEKGFAHLQAHNLLYCDDGKENIIDEYCALLAAVELYATTQKNEYLIAAEKRAMSLCQRLSRDEKWQDWWRSDDTGDTPFFHGADAGLPVVTLIRFLDLLPDSKMSGRIRDTIKRSMQFELRITDSVSNPFGYARQYIKPSGENKKDSFFIPHKNPSGYWWQGENSRIASLATAALRASRHIVGTDIALKSHLQGYAQNQLNWILGLNPFDACMLKGVGRNNPAYDPGYYNAPGGISNGITAGYENEADIDFIPEQLKKNPEHTWRWGEQWLSHAVWYMLAISSIE